MIHSVVLSNIANSNSPRSTNRKANSKPMKTPVKPNCDGDAYTFDADWSAHREINIHCVQDILYNLFEMLYDLVSVEPAILDTSEIPNGVHVVTVAHFSVQEFLTSDAVSPDKAKLFSISPRESHCSIARTYLAYLYHYNTWSERMNFYPLREYAWYYWERHIHSQLDSQSIWPKDRLRSKAIEIYSHLTSWTIGLTETSGLKGSQTVLRLLAKPKMLRKGSRKFTSASWAIPPIGCQNRAWPR